MGGVLIGWAVSFVLLSIISLLGWLAGQSNDLGMALIGSAVVAFVFSALMLIGKGINRLRGKKTETPPPEREPTDDEILDSAARALADDPTGNEKQDRIELRRARREAEELLGPYLQVAAQRANSQSINLSATELRDRRRKNRRRNIGLALLVGVAGAFVYVRFFSPIESKLLYTLSFALAFIGVVFALYFLFGAPKNEGRRFSRITHIPKRDSGNSGDQTR